MADEELEVELSIMARPGASAVRPDAARSDLPVGAHRPPAEAADGDRRTPIRIAALIGSVRHESLNGALLEAIRDVAPAGVSIGSISLTDVPFYDGDLERGEVPAAVRELKEAIASSDALLVVTPEYNRGLPAVIKNAIDWASRPAFASPLVGKFVLLTGASSGRSAVKYALEDAAQALAYTQAVPFERRFGVARAGDLMDAEGRLADPRTNEELRELLAEFTAAVRSTAAPTTDLAA